MTKHYMSFHFHFLPQQDEKFDLDIFLERLGKDIREKIAQKLLTHNGMKWKIIAKILFDRKNPENEIQETITYFRSSNYTELVQDSFAEHLYEAFRKIKTLAEDFVNMGSGWVFREIKQKMLK